MEVQPESTPVPDPKRPEQAAESSEPPPSTEARPSSPDSSDSTPAAEPEFTPLGEAPAFDPLPEGESEPEVIPFTGEEIATGVAWAVTAGLRLEDKEQIEAFQRAFIAAVPFMPTPAVLDALQVGEALAAYGIHKGMVGGTDALAALPPWLRLIIGAGYLAFAVYAGVRAAKEVKGAEEAKAGQPPAPGPDAPGAGLGEEVLRGPFQTAGTL